MIDKEESESLGQNRPSKKPIIVRIFRALKRYEYSRHRRKRYSAEHHVNERMMARWTRIVGLFTAFLFAVNVGTSVIFWRQLGEMQATRESSDRSTSNQLKIMGDQLDQMDIAQRPWVRLSRAAPVGLIVMDVGVVIDLQLRAKNIGHSPAEGVYATGRAFSNFSFTEAAPAARAVCKGAFAKNLEWLQSMIFPDEEREIEIIGGFYTSMQDIMNERMDQVDFQYNGSIPFVGKEKAEARKKEDLALPLRAGFTVVGCILYSYRGGNAFGQTAFLLDLNRSCPEISPLAKCSFDVRPGKKYLADEILVGDVPDRRNLDVPERSSLFVK
jgi:hypothetical protein